MSALSRRARIVVTTSLASGALTMTALTMTGAPALATPPPGSRVITVTQLGNRGGGSLRAAIEAANASLPGETVIDFAVAGRIRLTRSLPVISSRVTIDGTSAPTYTRGGPPVVEVNGAGHAGLRFAAGSAGSQLLGLAVDNASGAGVTLSARSITVNADYIGLNLAGAAFGNRGDGIEVTPAASNDHIGLNNAGTAGTVANVISGNAGSGILLEQSTRDTLVANRIGTNPAGTAAVSNGGDGIAIVGGADDEVGGTDYTGLGGQQNNPTGSKGTVPPVFVVPPQGNLVSGNAGTGILIAGGSRDNMLNGNFVGTSGNGDAAIGNGGNGVWIRNSSDNSLVGCKFVNNPFVYYNVLSGNGGNGLRITDSDGSVVQGNFFGVGANNTTTVRNRLNGILVDGSSANTQVGGVIPLGNVSAGNGRNGIAVTGTARGFTTFNTFGGLLAFKGAAPNRRDGLLITSTGGDNLARTNVFSGNTGNGIELAGDASGVTVDPDIAGLTTSGKTPLPNGGDGLRIDGRAHGNIIGGSRQSVIPQNTFAGNRGYGVTITGRAHGNRVFGGFIGTNIFGLAAAGNGRGGVLLAGHAYGNTIGQLWPRPSNLISGNTGNGVTLLQNTRGNRVINNYIGRGRVGQRLPNTGQAIENHGLANLIRGNRI